MTNVMMNLLKMKKNSKPVTSAVQRFGQETTQGIHSPVVQLLDVIEWQRKPAYVPPTQNANANFVNTVNLNMYVATVEALKFVNMINKNHSVASVEARHSVNTANLNQHVIFATNLSTQKTGVNYVKWLASDISKTNTKATVSNVFVSLIQMRRFRDAISLKSITFAMR